METMEKQDTLNTTWQVTSELWGMIEFIMLV